MGLHGITWDYEKEMQKAEWGFDAVAAAKAVGAIEMDWEWPSTAYSGPRVQGSKGPRVHGHHRSTGSPTYIFIYMAGALG